MIHLQLKPDNLHTPCVSVTFDKYLHNLRCVDQMIKCLRKNSGIGLAANQVGMNKRLFVMLINHELYVCFNPEIIEFSADTVKFTEGCLSFPNDRCEITRPKKILARYQNARGQYDHKELDNLVARCYQHELDHLNGITMHERIKQYDQSQLLMEP